MSTFSCFVQIVLGSSGHNIFLMSQIIFQYLHQIHDLRLVIDQCQHDHTKSIL